MKIKTIKHNKKEVCKLSKKEINTDTDRYCIIVDCYGSNITSVGFYKADVLSSIIKGNLTAVNNELSERYKKLAGSMMARLKGLVTPPQ